jgi:hypothetical protein
MAESAAATSSSSMPGKESEVDDMLAHLELFEDELEDVVIAVEDVKEFQKELAGWRSVKSIHQDRLARRRYLARCSSKMFPTREQPPIYSSC